MVPHARHPQTKLKADFLCALASASQLVHVIIVFVLHGFPPKSIPAVPQIPPVKSSIFLVKVVNLRGKFVPFSRESQIHDAQ